MKDKLLNFLGICKRAGCLISGAETVTRAVTEHKAALVLYASDASENSLKKTLAAAKRENVPAARLDRTKEALSFALGKHCAIICTTDAGFAEKISELMKEESSWLL